MTREEMITKLVSDYVKSKTNLKDYQKIALFEKEKTTLLRKCNKEMLETAYRLNESDNAQHIATTMYLLRH